jgi:predicted nuclease of predicted toxin-antitoxin system
MHWLLDQGLPRSAATLLNERGMDAIHVGDVGMSQAADCEILQFAIKEGRIVVTLDSDFHTLLALSGNSKPSVVRIREEGLKGLSTCELIVRVWNQFADSLSQGCVITTTAKQARMRILPIQ